MTDPGWEAPRTAGRLHWLDPRLGGAATLRSYGVNVADDTSASDMFAFQSEAQDVVPTAHVAFLEKCALSIHIGAYFFAHAGVRPGVPLSEQVEQDLIWIRNDFLYDTRDQGAEIVHGHTPVDQVENHINRIAIDTGAVIGGSLSVLVLADDEVGVLNPDGVVDLPPMRGLRIRS